MKIKILFLFTLIILCYSILCIHCSQIYGASETRAMNPIFDGKDGLNDSELKLDSCKGWDENFDKSSKSIPNNIDREFKSRKITFINEWWDSSSRMVNIQRWYFDHSNDAVIFPRIPGSVCGSQAFPGWDAKADIGDKTCWLQPRAVLFVKGNVLVRIYVNSKILGKEYVKRLAKIVADKL